MATTYKDMFDYQNHAKTGDLITIGEHLDIKRVYKVVYNNNLYLRKSKGKEIIWISDAKDFCRNEPIIRLSNSDYKQIKKHYK